MFKTSTFRVAATLATICLSGSAWALGSTPVTVVNPADIAKAEGIQHPYQKEVHCSFQNNGCFASLTSPTTQRLVFEYISGSCPMDAAGGQLLLGIFSTVAGVSATNWIPAPPSIVSDTRAIVNFGQVVRIYADQNTEIDFTAGASGTTSNAACTVVFSGQAIDVP
jgi:hypothetical protein